MKNNKITTYPSRFEIIFEKLAEAKTEYNSDFSYEFEQISETNKTIALFKEFQDNIADSSYSFITRS